MAWTTPITAVASAIATAAQWNASVRDNLLYLKGDAGWTAPTLTGSWVNYGGAHLAAGYKRVGDFVYVRGTLKDGTGTAFTLPAGYRPSAVVTFGSWSSVHAGILIDAGGAVSQLGGSNTEFSLNCFFPVV